MNPSARIGLQPCWVLHRRDFRDSSQIVEVLSREHGRLAMVARGVKRPRSRHRGLLQPFSPLLISWVAGRELATMTDVEQGSGLPLRLDGDRLLAGFYLNELLLKLTTRFDPQTQIFDLYATTLPRLASAEPLAPVLREFEMRFLDDIGFGIDLRVDRSIGEPVDPAADYAVIAGQGAVASADPERPRYRGALLLAIANGDWSDTESLPAARRILAEAIDLQLGGKPLQSRRVLREMRKNTRRREQQTS